MPGFDSPSTPRPGAALPLIGSRLCIVHIEELVAPLLWQQELTILDDLGVHKGEDRGAPGANATLKA